ncbi:MAG: DUF58 domain-containing protein [Tissierellia bacterium]|nr:DUF58 domain-containing protein [Tissierellia bacterium]
MMIWLLLSIVVASILINRIALQRSIMSFRYYLEPQTMTAEIGQPIGILSVVENHKRLPVSHVELSERYPEGLGGGEYRTSLYVRGFERIKRPHQVVAFERGLHTVEFGRLIIGDFLGITREFRRYPLKKEWVVYPKKIDLHDSIIPIDSTMGELSVRRWILPDPIMIRGIREYTGMESQKSIHWPSSLRQGRLMVKEFDFTADQSCLILLNIQTSPPTWEKPKAELIEQTIRLTRALADELEDQAIPFAVRCNAYNYLDPPQRGYTVHTGLGDAHMDEVLDMLGRIDYKVGTGFTGMLRQVQTQAMNQVTVIIMTPIILESYLEEIDLLAGKVARVVVFSLTDDFIDQLPRNVEVYRGADHA